MLIRIMGKLSDEFERPLFGLRVKKVIEKIPLTLDRPSVAIFKDKLVITSTFDEIPDISQLIGVEVLGKRVINVKGLIVEPDEVDSLPSSGCAHIRLVTPYPFEGNGIPAIRDLVRSSLKHWKEMTGRAVKVGRLTPLQMNLKVIRGRWGRGIVGKILLKGEGAPAFGYISSIVGVGDRRELGYGYVEQVPLDEQTC